MSSTVTDLSSANSEPAHNLASLSRMSLASLEKLYKDAPRPTTLSELVGDPVGRMLAVRGTSNALLFKRVRALAGARWFPWNGKSFMKGTAKKGRGINRVHLWGRHQLFPFETSIRDSAIDKDPCVLLSYDLPENPPLVRRIHDEIREVSPGVWMGPAMWKSNKPEPALVLWFALAWR